MRIVLLTDRKKSRAAFASLSRSRDHTVEVRPPADFKAAIAAADRDTFIYVDAAGLSLASVRARIKSLVDTAVEGFGFVDLTRTISDVADLFHRGAADYIGADLPTGKITAQRFARILDFAGRKVDADLPLLEGRQRGMQASPVWPPLVAPVGSPSGSDWNDVVPGREYTFQILFVGLDHVSEMGRKSSEELLRSLRRTLQNILTRAFAPVLGRIFVWKEDSGLLLIPYDGENVTALIPAMRLVLNRTLINIEQFSVTTPISWRMGLHVGNTTYTESGGTSAIVSETLNFIFHLGDKAARPGELVVTWPALGRVPERVRSYFTRIEDFEGTALFRMKEPL